MSSAISFGVFCRLAPSTSEIMRSRNVLPGSDVMRTTILSESTLVPPVTALRSPPLSRMTGADSPVIADSSTAAMPSMTSPSPGMISPASTTTTSPRRSSEADDDPDAAAGVDHVGNRVGLHRAQRVGLRLAPTLRHRLGEVGEQHREPQPRRDRPDEAPHRRAPPNVAQRRRSTSRRRCRSRPRT